MLESTNGAAPSEAGRTPRAGALLSAVLVGVIAGVLAVVLAASFAAFVYVGPLSRHLTAGIGMNLLASVVIMAVLAAATEHRGAVGSIQDAPAAILGLAAANITATAGGGDGAFLTVVLAIALTTFAAGALFFALGALRLGDLVRFVPYPVVRGFLAGTGWLFVKGAVGTMTGRPLTMSTLPDLASAGPAIRWLPGLALALGLLVAVPRVRHVLLVPGTVLGAMALFHGARVAWGLSLEESAAAGWLVGHLPEGGLWQPWLLTALGRANWAAIAGQAGTLASVLLVAVLAVLLNVTAIELAADRDVDLNRELRATGMANLLAAPTGGSIGFHAVSLTALAESAGTPRRLVGVVAAAVCGAVLLFGGTLVSAFPRFVLGGLILYLGLNFLVDAVYRAWFVLGAAEYAVVMLILLVVALVGFLPAVAVGLVAAVVLFAVNYSRTEVVRSEASGATRTSNVERPDEHREALARRGDEIHVLQLQGYVFFGTARRLLERIERRVRDPRAAPVSFLVLDFARVTGIDSSAVQSFVKVARLASAEGFDLVLTHLPEDVERKLRRGGLDESRHERVRLFPDHDRALEWCENRLLELEGVPDVAGASIWSRLGGLAGAPVDMDRLLGYLDRVEVPAGHLLIRQGEAADDLFLLDSGALSVTVEDAGRHLRLRTVGPGAVVGELPLYLGGTRTASVVAETSSVVYRLPAERFREMERRDPDLASTLHRALARLLAQRLAGMLKALGPMLD